MSRPDVIGQVISTLLFQRFQCCYRPLEKARTVAINRRAAASKVATYSSIVSHKRILISSVVCTTNMGKAWQNSPCAETYLEIGYGGVASNFGTAIGQLFETEKRYQDCLMLTTQSFDVIG